MKRARSLGLALFIAIYWYDSRILKSNVNVRAYHIGTSTGHGQSSTYLETEPKRSFRCEIAILFESVSQISADKFGVFSSFFQAEDLFFSSCTYNITFCCCCSCLFLTKNHIPCLGGGDLRYDTRIIPARLFFFFSWRYRSRDVWLMSALTPAIIARYFVRRNKTIGVPSGCSCAWKVVSAVCGIAHTYMYSVYHRGRR